MMITCRYRVVVYDPYSKDWGSDVTKPFIDFLAGKYTQETRCIWIETKWEIQGGKNNVAFGLRDMEDFQYLCNLCRKHGYNYSGTLVSCLGIGDF